MSQITAPSTVWSHLESSLRHRRPVQVAYHGRLRIVCPHALGWKDHRPMVLGYQVGGHTSTGSLDPDPRRRWRCMFVDEIDLVVRDVAASWQSADNYNPSRPFPVIDEVSLNV